MCVHVPRQEPEELIESLGVFLYYSPPYLERGSFLLNPELHKVERSVNSKDLAVFTSPAGFLHELCPPSPSICVACLLCHVPSPLRQLFHVIQFIYK